MKRPDAKIAVMPVIAWLPRYMWMNCNFCKPYSHIGRTCSPVIAYEPNIVLKSERIIKKIMEDLFAVVYIRGRFIYYDNGLG